MLLNKVISISVFQVDDTTFDRIGEVNQYDSLIWPDKLNGYANFELWAPIIEENSLYFKKGNILWCGGDNACRIEIVKEEVDEYGEKKFNVKGRTLEMLLTTRIVWGTYNATSKFTSTIMYELVKANCVNPTDSKRKIPWLRCANDDNIGLKIDKYQKTGGEVYDACVSLASDADIGFNVRFDPYAKEIIFEVISGVDRTAEQTSNEPVIFSTDLEDLLSSSYYTNDQEAKTTALVMGEGEGADRKQVVSGVETAKGFERRELFVDARDLQSQTYEGGETHIIPAAQYLRILDQRGDEKLAEHQVVETFEARIRVIGDVQYEFGKDYKKGDRVTVRDKILDVSVSARITEVEEDFDEDYALLLTFGYSYPTIMEKVKQATTT